MSAKSIDHISENVSSKGLETFQLALNNGHENVEALDSAIDSASSYMIQIGIPKDVVDSTSDSLVEIYNNSIENGLSPQEAAEVAFESINDLLIDNNVTPEVLNTNNESVSERYNMDFANPSNSNTTQLLDEAIANGMSVEEAIKYVNNQMFPSVETPYGPPTLAEIQEITNNKENFADKNPDSNDDDNKLSKMEADMDAQVGESIDEDPNKTRDIDQSLDIENLNNNNSQDDDVS